MRKRGWSLILWVTWGCASGGTGTTALPAAAPTSIVQQPAGDTARARDGVAGDDTHRRSITIPGRIASYALARRHKFDDPGAGIVLQYRGPDSLTADVFVYPGPDFASRCDSDCAAGVFEKEMLEFRSEFPELLRRNYFDAIEVAAEESLKPDAAGLWRLGRVMRLAVVDKGQQRRSDFYLFYLPGFRVKVRMTYTGTPERTVHIDSFIRDLMPSLVDASAER